MKTLPILLALIIALPTLGTPAVGQTLSERIAAVRQKHREQQAARQLTSPRAKMLQTLVYSELTVQFDQTPAREALEYIRTALGINLIARYSDDAVGHGIDPKTPITLKVTSMPAIEVLELVLEQCSIVEECTWQLRGSFVEVGTRERLSVPGARELRVYPIDDLIFEPRRFDDAPPAGILWGLPGFVGYGGEYYGGFGGYGGTGIGGGINPGGTGRINAAPRRYGAYGEVTTPSPNTPELKRERAEEIVELIMSVVEPDAWEENGGEWATIEYRDGALLVNAPDFIQRQINGYPHVPRPEADDETPSTLPAMPPTR